MKKTKNPFFLPLLLVACGGTSATPGPPASGTCSYTYSGALTGNFSSECVGGVAAYDSVHGIAAVTFADVANDTYSTSGALEIVSASGISDKTYSLSDASAQGVIGVVNGGQEWTANTATNGVPATGTFTLNVTSNNSYATSNGVTVYYIHGTADATLTAVAGSGATGTVTFHAVF